MLVFSTRLPLKETVSQEQCLKVFIDWVTGSPHYNFSDFCYNFQSKTDYDFSKDQVTISFRHYSEDATEVTACRLENKEDNAIWYNDCVFVNENGNKTVSIQLNCSRVSFTVPMPKAHKPYIVRKYLEEGLCDNDGIIPVTDYAFDVTEKYYNMCVQIMNGTLDYSMPVVYVSCDSWGKTMLDSNFLARELSGLAHVFVEKNYETALKLREETSGNNVHLGYIGVYFPKTTYCQRYCIDSYSNYKLMTRDIIDSIWESLNNRLDATKYNWNQIVALQSRQRVTEWKDISEQRKADLDSYVNSFDKENDELRLKINEINSQNYALRSQLDALKARINAEDENTTFLRVGKEPALYPSERNDLLYSILSQVKNRYEEKSRARTLIESLLEANPKTGSCERVIETVKRIIGKGSKLSKNDRQELMDVGFSFEEDGPHYKMTFHNPQYMFIIAKTPSDHREGHNLASDICKIIDVEKKF